MVGRGKKKGEKRTCKKRSAILLLEVLRMSSSDVIRVCSLARIETAIDLHLGVSPVVLH